VLPRNFVGSGKNDDVVRLVNLAEAKPDFARVLLHEGLNTVYCVI